ncbi:hypothetical protein E2C01_048007 [Portunus trituberculatus]|uniref:Uncharacterized protein n=1 Tax=Portunus trituberculatus TaxID=210409 RepID=A0A5B7G205_PORTR|nr:hypothetical protein [Portunus trituberculatus]
MKPLSLGISKEKSKNTIISPTLKAFRGVLILALRNTVKGTQNEGKTGDRLAESFPVDAHGATMIESREIQSEIQSHGIQATVTRCRWDHQCAFPLCLIDPIPAQGRIQNSPEHVVIH